MVGVLTVVHLLDAEGHEGVERPNAVGRPQADSQLPEQSEAMTSSSNDCNVHESESTSMLSLGILWGAYRFLLLCDWEWVVL